MKNFLLVLFVILLLGATVKGQHALTQQQLDTLDRIANQDVPPGAPGIATAILKAGKVILIHYAGYADLSDSVKIDSLSRFNLASNGKQFTALAVLKLIDQGRLKLSDDLRQFLPALYPDIGERITITHLLTHTSGIRDVYGLWSLQGLTWWEQPFNNQDVLHLIEQQTDLNFQPGTKQLYSNTNYILLALVVERVTGRSFRSVTDELFASLNMPNTSFKDDHSTIEGPIARAYFNFDTWTTYDWVWDVVGDGNLFSTLPDQIQWEKIVQGKATTSISPAVIRQSQQLGNGSTAETYGYGLEFGEYKGLAYKFHEGARSLPLARRETTQQL